MSDIDIGNALSSPSLAFKYYINYYYQGNSLDISPVDMGQIQNRWSDKIPVWKNYVENGADQNVYDIDESDYDDAVEWGREHAKELSGYQNTTGQKIGQGTRAAVDVVFAAGQEFGKKEAVAKSTESAKTRVGLIVSCIIDVAIASLYLIKRPNKTQKEAIDAYHEEMGNQLSMTEGAQYDILNMDEELRNLGDEANNIVDEGNTAMGEAKAEYDFNMNTIEYFKSDVTSGYRLTDSDKEAYVEAVKNAGSSSEIIQTTRASTSESVNDIHDEMSGYKAGFDEAIETVGNVEGFTNEAASVDKMTQILCYVEGGAKTLDAGFAAKDGYKALTEGALTSGVGIGCAIMAVGALALAAAAFDGVAAAEQFKWAKEIGDEIKDREDTQETNVTTSDTYNDYIDYYGGYMTDVEGLSIEVPDDVAPPEDTSIPTPEGGDEGDDKGPKKKNPEDK